jgi:N-acetylmuramoyl-L-alanine amidase
VLETGKIKDYSVFLLRDPYRMVVDVHAKNSAVTTAANSPALQLPATQSLASPMRASSNRKSSPKTDKSVAVNNAPPTDDANAEVTGTKVYGPPAPPASSQPAVTPINNKSLRPKTGQVADATPVPAPTRDGQQSLSRALGLKIGHIVIDAGHGGHDTGTVGPTGLMEKDLCLDVALRLGQMIQDRLPGTEVTYTRSDDTFVPLEQRTNIANEAKADLFISIHANSSPDSSARGVETYYLNFSPSPEAMQVAARENATAQNGVHDLDDLIQRIERNEKIEESRELATDIQDSLSKDLQRTNHSIKNRGVRKAPFVVLIGANMPSVLAEISFISNPSDESALEKPDGRERVAEGLFQGIQSYLQSTNSLAAAQAKAAPGARTAGLASSGNQR